MRKCCCLSAMRSIPRTPPYLYYTTPPPQDTLRQNIMVTIPGPFLDGMPKQQERILNDVVEVPLKYAGEVLGGKWGSQWALGYALTVHLSKDLTIADTRGLDHRLLPSMVESRLPCRIKSGAS